VTVDGTNFPDIAFSVEIETSDLVIGEEFRSILFGGGSKCHCQTQGIKDSIRDGISKPGFWREVGFLLSGLITGEAFNGNAAFLRSLFKPSAVCFVFFIQCNK